MLRCKELMHWILSREVWARDLAGTVCCVLEQDKTLARLASHPGGGGGEVLRLLATETGISCCCIGHLPRVQTLPMFHSQLEFEQGFS